MDPAVRQIVYDFLECKGMRRTVQRDAIIEATFSSKEHFTAEELLVRAKGIEPSVSRATVYRTLPLMVASGVLREMDFGKDQAYYDPNFIDRPHHNHLICTDCNRIVEFEDTHMEILENCITHRLGFSPTMKTTRIEASCDELKRHGTCQKRMQDTAVHHQAVAAIHPITA